MIEVLFGESEAAAMKVAKNKIVVGTVKEPMASPYRKELIYSMYAQNQWEQDGEIEKNVYEKEF